MRRDAVSASSGHLHDHRDLVRFKPWLRVKPKFALPGLLLIMLAVGLSAMLTAAGASSSALDGAGSLSSAGEATTLLPYGASGYRYKQIVHGAPFAGFEAEAYDDSSWDVGAMPFGNESGGFCGLNRVTQWDPDTDLLVRRTFTVPAGTQGVTVRAKVDNDITLYVNGHNVSGPAPLANEGCADHQNVPDISVDNAFLHLGAENVLAVRAFDRGGSTHLDLEMTSGGTATLTLAPATQSHPVGDQATVTAHLVGADGLPVANAHVDLTALNGPNAGTVGSATTDASGDAVFHYASTVAGTDTLQASATTPAALVSTSVTVEWQQPTAAPGKIVYTRERAGTGGTFADVWSVDPDGGSATNVTKNDLLGARSPSLSPNGSQIAFAAQRASVTGQDAMVINADGTGLRNLTSGFHPQIDKVWDPTWSPDGTRIAFKGGPYSIFPGTYPQDVYLVNADGSGALTQLTHLGDVQDAAWSPVDARIAFTRESTRGLYTVNPSGDVTTVYVPACCARVTEPAWSPDGTRIALETTAYIGSDIISVNSSDGGGLTRLTAPGAGAQSFGPSWSPDGSRIVFSRPSGSASYGDLFSMGATAGEAAGLSQVTSTGTATEKDPWWGSAASGPAPAATQTALSSSANPSVTGQPVTYTATVTSDTGTPSGAVTFSDGATAIVGCVGLPLSSGYAACPVTYTSPGTHAITAAYTPDSTDLQPSASAPLTQAVNRSATTTVLNVSPASSAFGQQVTLTATVNASSPGAGSPTGTVTFFDGASTLGTGTLDGSGHATFFTSTLAPGARSLTASYAGDTNYLASTSAPASATVATLPGAPTAVSATAGDGSATVTWTAPASDGGSPITGYVVTPYIGNDAQASISVANVTSTTVSGLTNGTTYTFKVAARNAIGAGPESASSNAVTPAHGVVGLTAGPVSVSVGQFVTATWSGLEPSGNDWISMHPAGAPDGDYVTFEVITGDHGTKTFNAPGWPGAFEFRLFRNGAKVATSNTFTVSATVPNPPTGVSATAGDRSATLTWTPPGNDGGSPITGYVVTPYIGTTAQTAITVDDVASTTVSGLTNGTTYTFKVAARNAIGIGPDSAASNAVTPMGGGGSGSTLSVTLNGQGRVTSAPAGIDCPGACSMQVPAPPPIGYSVTLTAVPAPGWAFYNWTDLRATNFNACSGTNPVCSITNLPSVVSVVPLRASFYRLPVPAGTGADGPGKIVYRYRTDSSGHGDVWIVNPDGSGRRNVTNDPELSANTPALSPDGRRIAFANTCAITTCYLVPSSNHDIYVVNADGSGPRNVTARFASGGQRVSGRHPTWSPDGTRLAFSGSDGSSSGDDVYVTDGATLTRITNVGDAAYADWSPISGDNRILFVRTGSANRGLWTVRSDGSDLRQLLASSQSISASPLWSPDGTRIVFESFHPDASTGCVGFGHVFTVGADGSGLTDLAKKVCTDSQPSWSPDGTRIVFVRSGLPEAGDAGDLFVMDASSGEGGSLARVTSTPDAGGGELEPDWGSEATGPAGAATQTTVSSSANPSVTGQGVTYTATVTAAGLGVSPKTSLLAATATPTGSVTFADGGTPVATCQSLVLTSGQATCSVSYPATATHAVTAAFTPDSGDFAGSSSAAIAQTVNRAVTVSTLAVSPSSSLFGQQMTLTATVSAVAPGSGTPTGTVTLLDGATTVGSGTLNGAQATLLTNALTPGTHSLTAVYAGDGNYFGSASAPASASVLTVPSAPVGVSATAANASATVVWTAPASDGGSPVTGYVVTPYVGAVALTSTTVGNVTSTTLSGLTNGTTYTFKVAARNAAGTGPESAASNAVALAAPSVVKVPAAPSGVRASAANASATVTWSAPASDGGGQITGYVLTPYVGAVARTPIAVGNVTSATVSGLTNGTTYTFTVAAKNAVGTGTESAASNAVTPTAPFTPPAARKCVVPNVLGRLFSEAKSSIKRASCRVGAVTYAPSKKAKKNRVIAQSPRPGKKLKKGASVSVTVGRGGR